MPTVSTIAKTSAMTCVQLTMVPKSPKRCSVVGSVRKRANAPPLGARHDISPSRISSSASVPIILTSGSRAAKAGPNTTP